MTPAPALTEATMDKMTVEQASAAENKEPPKGCSCPQGEGPVPCPGQHALWHCQHEAVLRGTHKIVPASFLSPPQDVAGLCEELRGLAEKAGLDEWICRGSHHKFTVVDFGDGGISLHNCPNAENRAKHIAAADPVNMTKLLDCVTSLSACNRELETRFSRQADNMAFILNHATLPEQWHEKFTKELAEDRAANLQGNGDE